MGLRHGSPDVAACQRLQGINDRIHARAHASAHVRPLLNNRLVVGRLPCPAGHRLPAVVDVRILFMCLIQHCLCLCFQRSTRIRIRQAGRGDTPGPGGFRACCKRQAPGWQRR